MFVSNYMLFMAFDNEQNLYHIESYKRPRKFFVVQRLYHYNSHVVQATAY